MKQGSARFNTSGALLLAGLLLAALPVEAADHVPLEEGGPEALAAQLEETPKVPPVEVHRGSARETVTFDAEAETGVQTVLILRGNTDPEEPVVRTPPAPPQAQLSATSGRNLWFYDPSGETVQACRLFKGQYVGQWKIRCFERKFQ